jgi:two-component system response regulator
MDARPIFLVEDNSDDEMLTRRAFKKSNVANALVVARDGEEALAYLFDANNKLPAVILLDLKLPRVRGIEVLKRLRSDERTRLLPVIVLTSSNVDSDLRACYELGCNSYIQKPVDFDKFVDAISLLGMYWLVVNEPPHAHGP